MARAVPHYFASLDQPLNEIIIHVLSRVFIKKGKRIKETKYLMIPDKIGISNLSFSHNKLRGDRMLLTIKAHGMKIESGLRRISPQWRGFLRDKNNSIV